MATDLHDRFWLCKGCGRHVPARLAQCRCGTSRAEGEAALEPAQGAAVEVHDGPAWFAVAPAKLVVMSVATVGLYQVYWFYKHWRAVRDAGEDVLPWARSIFGVLFCYSLFRRVADSAAGLAAPAAPLLAAVYIALCVSAQLLPFPYTLLAALSVLPLVPIQSAANAVAQRDFPHEAPDARFTAANWLGVALGCAFFGFLGHALVVRARAGSLESLTRMADALNRSPHSATDGVQLEKVVALEGMLVYRFALTEDARARIEERKPFLKAALTSTTCRDRLLKLGVAVRFVYAGPAGEDVATVDVSPRDCR
jgi:hypothetical protein